MKRTMAALFIALGLAVTSARATEPVVTRVITPASCPAGATSGPSGAACPVTGSCGSVCGGGNAGCGTDHAILGKLKGWFTYRACERTPLCCEPAPRTPPLYTYFITPCREGAKPACCDKGSCGCTGFLGSGHRLFSLPTGHGCSAGCAGGLLGGCCK